MGRAAEGGSVTLVVWSAPWRHSLLVDKNPSQMPETGRISYLGFTSIFREPSVITNSLIHKYHSVGMALARASIYLLILKSGPRKAAGRKRKTRPHVHDMSRLVVEPAIRPAVPKEYRQKPLERIVARRPNVDGNWDHAASQTPPGRAKKPCPK